MSLASTPFPPSRPPSFLPSSLLLPFYPSSTPSLPLTGDGGPSGGGDPCGFAQNGKNFLGKILRIDVDNIPAGKAYGVPRDNPFVNRSATVWKEVFALGLRNPWRCDVDSKTGQIVCGDVGQVR